MHLHLCWTHPLHASMHPHTVLSPSLSLLLRHVINLLPLSDYSIRNGVKRQLRRAVHEPRRDSGTSRSQNLNLNPRTNPCLLRCRPTVLTVLSFCLMPDFSLLS